MTNLEYVRLRYPKAKRGVRVQTYLGEGVITSADEFGRVRVRIAGRGTKPLIFHPGDVTFLEQANST